MSAFVIKNLRAVPTTAAQKKAHPLRIMTILGTFFDGIEAEDGTVTAGPEMSFVSKVITNGIEWKTEPTTGKKSRVGIDASADGFRLDRAAGVLVFDGGTRGRPTAAGADDATVDALLASARKAGTVDASEGEGEGETDEDTATE